MDVKFTGIVGDQGDRAALDHGHTGNARSVFSSLSVGPISRPKSPTKYGTSHRQENNSESEKLRVLNSLSLDDIERGYGFHEIWYGQHVTWGTLLYLLTYSMAQSPS